MNTYLGQTFNRVTIQEIILDGHFKPTRCIASCACGTVWETDIYKVTHGYTRSCGCLNKERLIKQSKENPIRLKHGCAKAKNQTAEYRTWVEIKKRCLNPKHKNFPRYGGNGITVCESWIMSFEQFLSDMGLKPSKEHSIDRIDNSLGYSRENCRWATRKEQNNNKTTNHRFLVDGSVLTTKEMAEHLGISISALYMRLHREKLASVTPPGVTL